MSENCFKIAQNARIAFRGNGIIHLKIAEFYEDHIGGQKKRAPIAKRSSKWANSTPLPRKGMKFVKGRNLSYSDV